MVWKCGSNRQDPDWFANVLCDQNNGTMGSNLENDALWRGVPTISWLIRDFSVNNQ